MKFKFVKNAFGYKADQEVELTADEAKAFGDAVVEVKASDEEVATKAVDELLDTVRAEVKAEVKAEVAKTLKSAAARKPTIYVGPDRVEEDPNHGFKTFGEYAAAVKAWSKGHATDERLKSLVAKAGSPTNSGGSTADGGALIPVGFSNAVIDAVKASDQLFPYVDSMPISGRTMTIPVIKHYDFSNTTATAGVVAAYVSEASDATISKSQWELLSLSVKTLVALVPTSEQLEEDAGVALGQFLTNEGARQINETVTKNILKNVSGGASGILGDGTTLHASVKAVTRGTANEVHFADVLGMYAAFFGDITKAVWVAHPSVLPQLGAMTSGNFNIFMPAGVGPNGASAPFGTLMGRPIIVSQYASALGGKGDIGLYDLSKYQAVYKGGINSAMSMHLYFASLQNAYRFDFRWDGKPKLTAPVTLADGSTTVSPFVALVG